MAKVILGNSYSKLVDATQNEIINVDLALSMKQPGYFFSPAYKAGKWDGNIRFFDKRGNKFPTGLLETVLSALEGAFEIVDDRDIPNVAIPPEIELYEPEVEGGRITLRDYQYDAVLSAIEEKRGILNLATNAGKTECAAGIIKTLLPKLEKDERILFVTHSKEIAKQSAERLSRRLRMNVGMVGAGVWDIKKVTVIMVPTVSRHLAPPDAEIKYAGEMKSVKFIMDFAGNLIKKGEPNKAIIKNVLDVLEEQQGKTRDQGAIDILTHVVTTCKNDDACFREFGRMKKALKKYEDGQKKKVAKKHYEVIELLESAKCFIADEAHHAASNTWQETLMRCTNAVYRIGLTGTVDESDELGATKLKGVTGEVIAKISNEFLIEEGHSAKPTIYLETVNKPMIPNDFEYQQAYEQGIVENEYRNRLIVSRVVEKYKEGKYCLIIVNRKKHGENLQELLESQGVSCEFTHGSYKNRDGALESISKGDLKVLIATTILDEGVSVDNIDCLFMAAGGKSYRVILQRVGRTLRTKKGKANVCEVYDYLDFTNNYLTKHTQERFGYYRDEKFDIRRYGNGADYESL